MLAEVESSLLRPRPAEPADAEWFTVDCLRATPLTH
jgi:hypothetical protein